MKKANNFKVHFSNILANKYHMNKKNIEGYWNNKEKEERFDNKKLISTVVGLSELIGAASLSLVDQMTEVNLVVPIILLGCGGSLTTKISVTVKNPYSLKEYKEVDREYQIERVKYKRLNR